MPRLKRSTSSSARPRRARRARNHLPGSWARRSVSLSPSPSLSASLSLSFSLSLSLEREFFLSLSRERERKRVSTTGAILEFYVWPLRTVETGVSGRVTMESVLESLRRPSRVRWNAQKVRIGLETYRSSREGNAHRDCVSDAGMGILIAAVRSEKRRLKILVGLYIHLFIHLFIYLFGE